MKGSREESEWSRVQVVRWSDAEFRDCQTRRLINAVASLNLPYRVYCSPLAPRPDSRHVLFYSLLQFFQLCEHISWYRLGHHKKWHSPHVGDPSLWRWDLSIQDYRGLTEQKWRGKPWSARSSRSWNAAAIPSSGVWEIKVKRVRRSCLSQLTYRFSRLWNPLE